MTRGRYLAGIFLIHLLNGAERANLTRKTLELLHQHNVIIPSMTFDSAAVNFTAVEPLGAHLTDGNKFKL